MSSKDEKEKYHESEDYRLQNLHEKGILISIFNVSKKKFNATAAIFVILRLTSLILIFSFNSFYDYKMIHIFKMTILSSIIVDIFNQNPLFCMALIFIFSVL